MGGMTIQAFAGQHVETLNERVRGVVLVATAAQPGWLRVPGPIAGVPRRSAHSVAHQTGSQVRRNQH